MVSDLAGSCTPSVFNLNTLRPRQNGRHFPDDIFKCIFLNESGQISIKISLKFVPNVPINNILTWAQIIAWRCPGDKPLSEPMTGSLLTHICVTRPQWVKPKQLSVLQLFKNQLNSSPPWHMAAISQTIFLDAFSWMKSFIFWLKFHWSLFLRVQLTITQRWLR